MNYRLLDTGKIIGVVLAGGGGTRLYPLTLRRAKPAVPIGGHHVLIDLPLSNLLNSVITHNFVVVQYQSASLMTHLDGYQSGIAPMRGQFIRVLAPPREVPRFFESDSDSLVQLRWNFEESSAEIVIVMMADQIVKIDLRQVVHEFLERDADAAMVYRAVSLEQARKKLGVLELDQDGFVRELNEKPERPDGSAEYPDQCLANLALYVFRKPVFLEMLSYIEAEHLPNDQLSVTGIPWIINHKRVLGYDLMQNVIPGMSERERGYFRDAGTLDSWFEMQMELCHRDPVLNLYSRQWPYFTAPVWPTAPAKFDRVERIDQAMIGPNVICQDDTMVFESVLSTGSIIGEGSRICRSVLLNDVRVGKNCTLNGVVIDDGITIPDGTFLDGLSPPKNTMKFADAYQQLITDGCEVPRATPILSDNGILFIPRDYSFA